MHEWGKEREQRESGGDKHKGKNLGWWGRMVEGVGNCSSVAEDKFYSHASTV